MSCDACQYSSYGGPPTWGMCDRCSPPPLPVGSIVQPVPDDGRRWTVTLDAGLVVHLRNVIDGSPMPMMRRWVESEQG